MSLNLLPYRGGLTRVTRSTPVVVRLEAYIDRRGPDECWPWMGTITRSGYGQISVDNRSQRVHRVVWELLRGPIPPGLVLDHECHNLDKDCWATNDCPHRRCCNVFRHIELVSNRTNVLRGKSYPALNILKTHCIHGHEFTTATTMVRPNRPNTRECRVCARRRDQERTRSR